MTTAIIDTSTANIASVRYAMERLNAGYILARDPGEARDAERLILPGVGAAGPAMDMLQARGWVQALRSDNRPLLGVCLGMQLLYEYSAEGDVDLLGLIPGQIEKLDPGNAGPWPHMGWNCLASFDPDEPLLQGVDEGAYVYFVHGFYAPVSTHTSAQTRYGEPITAIARKGHVAGCQFHPERSAETGARILKNFLEIPA